MGLLMSERFDSLDALFLHQLGDVYDAEKRLVEALPMMANTARSTQLRQAFERHTAETQMHIQRLEQIYSMLGQKPDRETCPAMKGLIKEGTEMMEAKGPDEVRDAALIASAQRVEHYEIAAYGTLRTLARQLGHESAAMILQQTLDEEGATDKLLTQIATNGGVNARASAAG